MFAIVRFFERVLVFVAGVFMLTFGVIAMVEAHRVPFDAPAIALMATGILIAYGGLVTIRAAVQH